jgi:hypothetical protein
MINCILGAGQVGSVIKYALKSHTDMFDVGEWEYNEVDCDILHICIPYSKKFDKTIIKAVEVFKPKIMVIHSTVKPGTSKKFNCLYSPVLGRHSDDFENNSKLYRKMFAGSLDLYAVVKKEFNFNCEYWNEDTDELEFSKIMSTTRMYWELIYNKELSRQCKKLGFSFNNVYHRWTDNYNAGIEIKHWGWRRTQFNEMTDELPGGHCLRPNIHLVDNLITRIIVAWERTILYCVTHFHKTPKG